MQRDRAYGSLIRLRPTAVCCDVPLPWLPRHVPAAPAATTRHIAAAAARHAAARRRIAEAGRAGVGVSGEGDFDRLHALMTVRLPAAGEDYGFLLDSLHAVNGALFRDHLS